MRYNRQVVPVASFAVAVLLSYVLTPWAGMSLRAQAFPTGPGSPCATVEIVKITAEAVKHKFHVTVLDATIVSSVGGRTEEDSILKIKVDGVARTTAGPMTFPGLPLELPMINTKTHRFPPGTTAWDLKGQKLNFANIEHAARNVVRELVETGLLGAPTGVKLTKFDITIPAQDVTIDTPGSVECKGGALGVFIQRPLTFAIDALGNGSGTR